MAKQIKQKDVIQADIWQNTIDSTKELINQVEVLNKELSKTAKASKKALNNNKNNDFDGLKSANDEIEKLNKNFNQKLTIDKERVKLEQKLKVLNSDSIQANVELKTQIAEQNKINKQLAKEKLNLVGAYEKESKRLIKLRKEYKDLIISEGKTTKETKKLAKQITKLDKELKDVDASAGQFQRNVGDYPDSMGDAANAILGVAAAALSAKASFDGVKGSLEANAEGSENVREVTSALAGAFSQVKNVVAGAALDLFDYGKAAISVIDGSKKGFQALGALKGGFDRTKEATKDFTQKVKDSALGQVELTRRIIDFEKAIRPLELRITDLNGLIEEQQIIAGDSTRSFKELNEAVLQGQAFQVERSKLVVAIAIEELAIINEKLRLAKASGGVEAELLNEQTEAQIKLKDARKDLNNEILENEKEKRQINQDTLERDLDILIDGFDNQKTINERKITNERETLIKRKQLLEETVALADKGFRGQKDIIEELSNVDVDIDELLSLDATELNKRIRELEQSEIIEGRTLEVIRERRIVLQDLEEAQQDINTASREGLDLEIEIEAQRTALYGGTQEDIDELEKERIENRKQSLIEQIEIAKDGSLEDLRLQKELNDLLLDENQKKLDELEKQEDEAKEKEIDNRKKVFAVLKALNDKFFDEKNKQADEEINDTQKRGEQLVELAGKGNKQASESLAENQKAQAEANRKKEELLQKQKQFEIALALIQAFNSELDAGKTTGEALTSAITSTTVLTSIAGSLPAFLDGTEDTGTAGKLDNNGGFHAILHDKERVMTKDQNAKMGGMANDDVANIVQDYNKGLLFDLNTVNPPQLEISAKNWETNEQILNRFDNLEVQLKKLNDKENYLGSDVDTMRKILTQKYQKGNTKININSKAPNIW